MQEPHECIPGSELDCDWTLVEDWDRELRLRQIRNLLIQDKLMEGKSVTYRQSGWSLYPRVNSNDRCTFKPVRFDFEVKKNDIVFCSVQPYDRIYAHLVKEKYWHFKKKCWYFTISNLAGRENGWCRMEHIHGILTETQP